MPSIEAGEPPELLFKIVNPALRTALKTPLGAALKQFMVLEFTGRKSGRKFSIPVSAHHLDGDLYAILEAQWKYNFRDGADAQVTTGGRTTRMRGELITDTAAVADIAHRIAQDYGPKKAQLMMGMKFEGDTVPSLSEFTEAATRLKVAAIRFTPA
ncbi:hypothetical protein A5757_10390 [Mycobacterium sp. 852013-51886_SCH5428379]|uniref:hypothetical protein n=1 Tax=Mycobacterium sp. 852013-51886_SCH5428379 TaxID=1834111 RepID=UPI00080155FA|nr:hypothetical protein [Mycobacterium sp. 852013-51886_SCH5428379]OBB60216.1 hypothetical protein A5757_10390 [Mycobacterium sp. 852013-51886_SCH5428379]